MTALRRYVVLGLGIVLVISGAVVWLTAPSLSAGFGWTAYAPLSSTWFITDPGGPQRAVAAVAAFVGGLLIAGWTGFRLGRRRP